MINIGGTTVYHLGDTCLFGDLRLIAERTPVDVALIPIGGHYTMDRHDAVVAAELIGAGTVIPVPLQHLPADRDRRGGVQVRRRVEDQLEGGRAGARGLPLAVARPRARANTASIISSVSLPGERVLLARVKAADQRVGADAAPPLRDRTPASAAAPRRRRARSAASAPSHAKLAERDQHARPSRAAAARAPGTAGRCRARPAWACSRAARSARPPSTYAPVSRSPSPAMHRTWAGSRSRPGAGRRTASPPTGRR